MDVTTDPSGKSNYVRFIDSTEKNVTDQWNFDLELTLMLLMELMGWWGAAEMPEQKTATLRIFVFLVSL